MTLWIDNKLEQGLGEHFISINPFSQEQIWQGEAASAEQVAIAVKSACLAFEQWKKTSFSQREDLVIRFAKEVIQQAEELAIVIAKETGKPLWEAHAEVAAMASKISISIRAYHERTPTKTKQAGSNQVVLRHYPLGVMAVFGPYNFPGHLPNGHIVPALLAGNTVVFKPSELTPKVADFIMQIWLKAGLPQGVINLVHGGKEVGEALIHNEAIKGVLFTGSAKTGKLIHQHFAGKPEKMLALEMGGNNPLVVSQDYGDLSATAYTLLQSAFISAGQRCTCARRVFIPDTQAGDLLLEKLVETTKKIHIASQFDNPAPFISSLISDQAAKNMMLVQENLLALGGKALLQSRILQNACVTPAIIDMTDTNKLLPDEEYFSPLLQVFRYHDFNRAIEMANATKFGLSAGLISTKDEEWQYFLDNIQAGIVNLNRPLTGASSEMPFGGIGDSGNLRPSAFYAADYCAYPVASVETSMVQLPESLSPGIIME